MLCWISKAIKAAQKKSKKSFKKSGRQAKGEDLGWHILGKEQYKLVAGE